MYLEYCNYNKYITDYGEEITKIFTAIDEGIKSLALPIYLLREVKEYLPDDIKLSAPVDYPSGQASLKSREYALTNTLDSNVDYVDYVLNNYLLHSKFPELIKEIETALKLCDEYKSELRVFLSYRYSKNILDIAKKLDEVGVKYIFPTIGYHHDDFSDNLIMCKIIEKNTSMKAIFNGYVWKSSQASTLFSTKIYGARLYSMQFGVK